MCYSTRFLCLGKLQKGDWELSWRTRRILFGGKWKKKKRCFIELRNACHASGVLGDWFSNRCEMDLLIYIVASRGRHYFPTFQMSKLRLREAHLTQPACGRDWSSQQVCHTSHRWVLLYRFGWCDDSICMLFLGYCHPRGFAWPNKWVRVFWPVDWRNRKDLNGKISFTACALLLVTAKNSQSQPCSAELVLRRQRNTSFQWCIVA